MSIPNGMKHTLTAAACEETVYECVREIKNLLKSISETEELMMNIGGTLESLRDAERYLHAASTALSESVRIEEEQ